MVPNNIQKVGWYKYSVPPGSARGTSVLVGHRDGTSPEPGVFYYLGSIKNGSIITINSFEGLQRNYYKVVGKQFIKKSMFPTLAPKIFTLGGGHRLVLISCAGQYDARNGGYQENVIVTAVPL